MQLSPPSFCNHLDEEEKAGYFAFIVFLMPYDCKYSVALPLSSMGRSPVFDMYTLLTDWLKLRSWSHCFTVCT